MVLSGPVYTDSNLVLEALRQVQGVALTRRSLVHDAVCRGELVQLSPIAVAHQNPYWLVWPMRSHGTAKLVAFSEWLKAEVANYLAQIH
jgi:LysR family glycine cleavage system transcriptional activator